MATLDSQRFRGRARSTRSMDTVSIISGGSSRGDSISTWASTPPLLKDNRKQRATFLGKDSQEWCRILVYHSIFLIVVALFWVICWLPFIYTLDYVTPRYKGNITGHLDQPGMGFRPKLDPKRNLIWFAPGQNWTWAAYANQMNDFFLQYEKTKQRNLQSCQSLDKPPKDRACAFDVDTFRIRPSPCMRKSEYQWGFLDNKPCVALKLNKMVTWKPEKYIQGIEYDIADTAKYGTSKLPPELEESYQKRKRLRPALPGQEDTRALDHFDPEFHIGVTCNGRNDADVDLVKNIEYWPKFQGFPRNFYPFLNQEGFISPVVLVQFTVELQKLVMIECKAWARNLQHDRYSQIGQVNFEILIDGSMPKGWKVDRTYLGPFLNAGLEIGNKRIIESIRQNENEFTKKKKK